MLTMNSSPPKTRNWLTWSTSLVTRETRAPRRSVFWVSSGRSCTWRNALIRSVASPRSDVVKRRMVIRYEAKLVTRIASPATSPIVTVNPTSGPPSALRPWSRVCWTAIGTMIWPTEASTARRSVTRIPSVSSGENAMPRRMVSIAPMSSPVSTWLVAHVGSPASTASRACS